MYITIEGPDATGKSTQAELLYKHLKHKYPNKKVILTKEPGSKLDPVCQQIREVILNPSNKVDDKTALLLFLADRAQHIEKVIKPNLKNGIVISDRSSISTVVYHVAKLLTTKQDISHDYFYEMLDFAQEIQPDLCFISNAKFEWCTSQLKERGALDRIESFGKDFHKTIHSLFNEIGSKNLPFSNQYIFGIRERMKCFPKDLVMLPDSSKNTKEQIHKFITTYCEDKWKI